MKLILTQEVTGLGAPGDVVEVKDGYARNYLIPRSLGVRWTRGGQTTVDSIRAARATREVRDLDQAKSIKAGLEAEPVQVQVRSGAEGRLFGAVTVSDIAAAIEASGSSIDKRKIIVDQPIRTLGTHKVAVRVHDEVEATVTLNVVAA